MLPLSRAAAAIVAQAFPACGTAGSGISASGGGSSSGGLGLDVPVILGFFVGAFLIAALSVGVTLFLALRMRPSPAAIPVWNLAPPPS